MKETMKIATSELRRLKEMAEVDPEELVSVALDEALSHRVVGLMAELDSRGLLDETTDAEDLVKEAVARGLDSMVAELKT